MGTVVTCLTVGTLGSIVIWKVLSGLIAMCTIIKEGLFDLFH